MQLTANSKHPPVLWIPKCYRIPQAESKKYYSVRRRGEERACMHQASLLYVEWNSQAQWDDDPLISACSFFCRKQSAGPQLLCKTCPSVLSPMVSAHSDTYSG